MTSHEDRAARFWDREVAEPRYRSWMAHPRVRQSINSAISGSPHVWPLEWFRSWLGGRTFRRGLSVGCGSGAFERDALRQGIVEEIDAFDGSAESIRIARDEAEKAGVAQRVHYSIANFNEPRLPRRTYDIVFAHQSLHHVAKLEKLFRAVLRTMTRDGLFYLDEYVGPSRHGWNEQSFASHRAIFDAIPERNRTVSELPLPIEVEDPSEAIRSDEILRELRVGFEIVERRDYGGNVLSPMFQYLDTTDADAIVDSLLVTEQALLSAGEESFYTVIVARPKRGAAARVADLRYFAVPKLKRIVREIAGTRVTKY
ncbi:MAG TPA: class I SAM-dependent methyltransferase [Thermoanaerobaculia bacterium]|jgi:SAM-dependent methyltransferase|nr:class I SAM-dependent methyltransferase [Thermoanaerobaculia bacterium]